MSSYFDEHDCTPLAEGTAPDELLQFARCVEREDLKRVEGNGEKERRSELYDVGLRYFEVQALSHPIRL